MNSLFNDLRFGLRMMVRNPVFSLIAVITLALGIGANTAIFSVVDAVLLRPLPYPDADRLVFLWSTMNSQGVPQSGSALPDYHGWRDHSKVFDGLGGFYYGDISNDYFRTFGISVREGRAFNNNDKSNSQPVAIVSEALVKRFFPGEDPLGKTIWMGAPEHLLPPDAQTPQNRFIRRTIVGVVSDVKGRSLNQEPPALVYAPLNQYRREGWTNGLMLAVQTTTPPETVVSAIREQVRLLDADQPITNVRTMDELLSRALSSAKFSLWLLGLFAVLGLLLAAIGIYGVMVTAVTQRTHEIGLRMALGAQTGDVMWLVIRQGMVPVLIGVVAGLAAAIGLTRLMSTLLFEVSATDPLTLALITVLLTVVALLACYIPARRATKVDPLVALRYE